MEKEAYAIYKIMNLKGVGPVLANKIIHGISESDENVFDVINKKGARVMLEQLLKPEQIDQLNETENKIQDQINELDKNNAGILTILDSNYPEILRSSLKQHSPPIITYYGNTKLLSMKGVGFCGSRKASDKGLEVARDCAEQLARKEFVIVSGHAAGVDQQTHHAALEAGGYTIIVLPEGLLNFKIKKFLKPVWDEERVLVISEFVPNAKWMASRAMQRNLTIIGLSQAMILIEAGKNGGSMDAGNKTLKMNKRLYAPVYENMPEYAIGNQLLREQGALPIMKNKKTGKAHLEKLTEYLNNFEMPSTGEQLSLI